MRLTLRVSLFCLVAVAALSGFLAIVYAAPAHPLSTSSPQVIATIGVGGFPQGVAVNPATNRIYVANNLDGTISVLDGASNQVIHTIQGLTGPFQIAVNPSTNRVYITEPQANTVAVINGQSNQVSALIPGFNSPVGIAVNPTTNRVYVTNGGTIPSASSTGRTTPSLRPFPQVAVPLISLQLPSTPAPTGCMPPCRNQMPSWSSMGRPTRSPRRFRLEAIRSGSPLMPGSTGFMLPTRGIARWQ